jgi:hypothetical protein
MVDDGKSSHASEVGKPMFGFDGLRHARYLARGRLDVRGDSHTERLGLGRTLVFVSRFHRGVVRRTKVVRRP